LNHEQSGEDAPTGRPTQTKKDAEYIALKATISSIPVVGGALAEVFSATVPSPVSKKTADWWDDLARRVTKLERSGISMESLATSDEFKTLVRQASQLANQNARQEKLEALRNAVVNAAAGIDIDADERQIFLQMVDQLTPSQLKMLEFLNDPLAYGQAHNVKYGNYMAAGIATIVEDAFPEWRGRREVYDLVLHDLQTRGLVSGNTDLLHYTMSATGQGIYASRTTERGKRFLKFIKAQP
jgi:hypothetical protein